MKFKPALSSPPLPTSKALYHLLQWSISRKTLHHHLPPIHAQSLVSGLLPDLFTTNLLLNGYSKAGLIRHARRLFDRMPERNAISWSSMISLYTQHNLEEDALFLFSCFHRSSLDSPNEFILASVLRACIQSRAIDRAILLHNLTIKLGLDSDVFVGTALINYFSKVGRMEGAMLVFNKLPVRNSVTWTTIITGYSQSGRSDVSLKLFNQMRDAGVTPDRFVLSSIVSACSAVDFLEGGRQVHGYMYRSGTEVDISVYNILIDLYCKCSRTRIARQLFNQMGLKNLVSWTTMISGYMQNSHDQEAIVLFIEMRQSGWQPDSFACTSILNSCGSLASLRQGKQVHGYTIKVNLEADEYVMNGIIDMYSKCDSLADARAAFDAMNEHNVVSYNTMIEGYARHEQLAEAFTLFNMMRSRSLRPSLLTFLSLLGVSSSLLVVDLSKQVHGLIIKAGASLDLFAGSALVDVYSKCACVNDARAVFDEMQERDLVVWNAMLFGYTQNSQGEEAVRLFHQLCESGFRPSDFTFVALVTVASNLASLFHGIQFHNQIIKSGVEYDPHVASALIDMYAKCGSIQEAWTLFNSTHGRDIVCWNSMISRFAHHGHAEEALRVFRLMRDEEIEPNYVTFVGVLNACGHVGLIDEGLCHFFSMKHDFGIEPGMEHYASVVNLLGRVGKLDEAKTFIEQMPLKPVATVWRSLLSACGVFGNVELGKYAAKMAILMDPNDSGAYVLISNIYASQGMWADTEKVRKGMDSIGAMKEPGCSWIEVMKEIHVFTARSREHRESDSIYSLLDDLMQMIKGVGYVPDTTMVLMNNGTD